MKNKIKREHITNGSPCWCNPFMLNPENNHCIELDTSYSQLTFPRKVSSFGSKQLVFTIPKELYDIVEKDCVYEISIKKLI